MPDVEDYKGMLADGKRLSKVAERMISFASGLLEAEGEDPEVAAEEGEEMVAESDEAQEELAEGLPKKGALIIALKKKLDKDKEDE